ncbi:antibiotic biosynthesis monooxygenase family protein [Ruegeria lacuscaerulensis]|uniref:antibiotic biosynthesis monooxygenase family protein n=2 Tax=Ruegeria TaxID=97050 RepID=UPI00147F3E14|nr:antibiotic biosynthesis monooxygenase family protein [Ruegeria lacuscaerulensis]
MSHFGLIPRDYGNKNSKMSFWTLLMIKVPAEKAKQTAEAFIHRNIIEECADAIPGFRHGELMVSHEGDGQLCVMCNWTDKAAYEQWVASPIRDKQNVDALGFLTEKGYEATDMHTLMFDSLHTVAQK